MAPVIFINIKNGTTIIHNITTLQMFPFKGDVLHIPYGSYRPRQRETSDTGRVVLMSRLFHYKFTNVFV